jgi:hypothetical protein
MMSRYDDEFDDALALEPSEAREHEVTDCQTLKHESMCEAVVCYFCIHLITEIQKQRVIYDQTMLHADFGLCSKLSIIIMPISDQLSPRFRPDVTI